MRVARVARLLGGRVVRLRGRTAVVTLLGQSVDLVEGWSGTMRIH